MSVPRRFRRTLARRRWAAAAAVTGALVVAGCTAQAPPEGQASGASSQTLNVAMSVAPTTLDPASGCTIDDSRLTRQLYVQLLDYGTTTGEDGREEVDPTVTEPYLAKSFDVSEDGLTYTFHLNEGWTFSSGTAVDAEAVKYSIDRVLAVNGCGASIVNDLFQDPDLISEITVVDPLTVEFSLSRTDPDFPLALATDAASIVDPSLVEANGGVVADTPNDWMASHDAGSGPFRLTSYEPGTKAVLTRDENFKGEAAASPEIVVTWVKSDAALLLQAQNGSTDVTLGLSKNSAASVDGQDGLEVVDDVATQNMQILLPNDKAPWTNPTLREAVTYAIPYQDLLDNVLKGYGELYYGPIPPTMTGFSEADSAARTYDVAKAKELVAQAGVTTPLDVTLDVISGDPTQTSIATIVQSSLKEIGIEVTVNPLSESAWGDAVYNGTTQMALRLDGPAVYSAGYYLQYDEACSSAYNTGKVCVPGNEELLDQARSATDPAVQGQALAQLTKNWVAASPKVVLYLDGNAAVVREGTTYYWDQATDMRRWAKAS
ncbi:ABC transporter substrate-binding protein [Kineococcus sp. SYSU DK003]|uniref:ABC transporter substrate-binding protein n=1 Tax=Kineococcus sp. SYSU DK003 TaxID=3383124 RepID=UPI003D7D1076